MTKPIQYLDEGAARLAPAQFTNLTARDQLTVRRILKVNHAGEHGAIRIYSAQIAVARWLYPRIVQTLSEMREHEVEHRRIFGDAMPARAARPCRIMALWSLGGSLLGIMTALLGVRAIWVCTAAVEQTVHEHLDDQLHFLVARDGEVHDAILSIRAEEMAHLETARQNLGPDNAAARFLTVIVAVSTHAVIWLSTWGDATRMRHELMQSRQTS